MKTQRHTTAQSEPCPRPFEWCEIHPDGSVFLCCPAWLKRPVGNLLRQPASDLWNSPVAQEIRKSILNGSYHNCHRKQCPRLSRPESGAVESASSRARLAIESGLAEIKTLPARLNLCFDQSCNLACPSCRTQRKISAGAEKQQSEHLAEIIRQQLLPTAEQLTLSGYGDPFGSPTYFSLLQQIDCHSCPQLEEIRLHTNGLLFDKEHWQQIPDIHPLLGAVEVSVDGASVETYKKNRDGDFARLLKNLDFIAGLGVPLRLSMVVQQNNFREIFALQRLAEGLGAELYLSRLVNWGTFSRQEYKVRNVCAPDHPEHQALRQALVQCREVAGVDCGNLLQLLTS